MNILYIYNIYNNYYYKYCLIYIFFIIYNSIINLKSYNDLYILIHIINILIYIIFRLIEIYRNQMQ